jgi:hypothetical protein
MKRIIERMLKENTGRAMMDSGDYYGRAYERNQGRNFENEAACQVEINEKFKEINISFDTYHYLTAYLDYDDTCRLLEKRFKRYTNRRENQETAWLTLMIEFAGFTNDDSYQGNGIHTTNTYNYDNILSQILQYVDFEFKGNTYILLQIHGGCDVRGGYTKPRIFRIPELDYFLMAQSDVMAGCENHHFWDSDDCGYHWYYQGSTKHNNKFDWKNIKIKGNQAICPCGKAIKFSVNESY